MQESPQGQRIRQRNETSRETSFPILRRLHPSPEDTPSCVIPYPLLPPPIEFIPIGIVTIFIPEFVLW